MMLEHGHNHLLMAAALAIALMSGFTGLSLTRGASMMGIAQRKLVVTMSALSLGAGIWSMHFVAMLGMILPVEFYYDVLITLISALVAILLTGIALLLVHFGKRTPFRITLAGICLGIGVLAMHYIGMSGIQSVRPVYSTSGLAEAIAASLVLCVASFWICYGKRDSRNILIGTVGFGLSVFAVHFIAMAGTEFVAVPDVAPSGVWMSNEVMALCVTFAAFVICGAFLLVSVTFATTVEPAAATGAKPVAHPVVASDPDVPSAPVFSRPEQSAGKLPYEKHGRIHFIPESEVLAVRAEGRYTLLYHASGRLFCPWSISELEDRVSDMNFVKCHRSYLVNPRHVVSFERKKDTGVCHFEQSAPLDVAPVSRSFLKAVRERLGV